jgi:hypothetical protein
MYLYMLFVVVFFVIIILIWMGKMTKRERAFYIMAESTNGIVYDHTLKIIEFKTGDGITHRYPYLLNQPNLKEFSGQSLTVYYHPNNPKDYRLQPVEERLADIPGITLLIGIIGVVLLIVSLFLYL